MSSEVPDKTNGAAAAAIFAAGFGCFAVGLCAWLGDAIPSLKVFFNFYNPTGPLSGVTTIGLIAWVIVWTILSRAWSGKSVAIGKINVAAFVLLGAGFLLTFPPFGDYLQRK